MTPLADKPSPRNVEEPCGTTFDGLSTFTDEELMAHLKAGHDDALAVLFDRYHRLVLSIAYKILRDLGEAEDTMQAVFLEIYRSAAQFNPAKGTTKVWLLQYAYHRSLNRRQYLRIRSFYDQSEVQPDAIRPSPFNLLGLLSLEETRRFIHQGLSKLNSAQKKTLELAYFEGLSMREIAEKTGESLGNVRHHYYRGLSRLRSLWLDADEKEKIGLTPRGTADAEA